MIVLCATSTYMLFNATSEGRSHAYYQILRWLVCLSSIVVSLNAHRWGHRWIPWLFGAVAILFNPVAPIHLPRESWRVIDMVTALVMLIAAFCLKPKRGSVEQPPV